MVSISVIIPVYNMEQYIGKCLDSVINQTLENIEIIVVDDGSNDKSLEICKQYEKKDKRITVVSKKNKGVSSARNEGLKFATGEYISFIDPDDWIENDMLFNMYTNCKKDDYDICMINYIVENINKSFKVELPLSKNIYNSRDDIINDILALLIGPESLDSNPDFIMGSVCRLIVKKDIVKSNNILFYENIKYGEDLLFCLEIFIKSRKVYIDDNAYYHYVRRDDSAVNCYRRNYYNELMDLHYNIMEILYAEGLDTRLKNRLDNSYYLYSLGSILNEFKENSISTYNSRLQLIKKICYDENIINILNKTNYEDFTLRKKFIIFCIKNKLVLIVYYYYRILSFLVSRGII